MPARPAIEGGKPVRKKVLPYGRQSIRREDGDAVARVLRSDWLTQGPMVGRFEDALARRFRARFAIAVSSGTAALHAACAVAGLRPGTVGVTTPITFSASANAVVYCGARPSFVDVASDWPLMDVECLRALDPTAIRAVIPVDYAGHPAPLDEVGALAREHGWTVIEDAAHAMGAEYRGRPVGGLSDMTMFSFHPVKHITTGEGGAILTNDEGMATALKAFRHHGIVKKPDTPGWLYDVPRLGHNFRLTDIQCALGLSQLARLGTRVARRRAIAKRYTKAFQGLAGIESPVDRSETKPSYHLYAARLRLDELRVGRRRIFDALHAEGLGAQVHYIPVHYLAFYRDGFGYGPGDFPNAEAFYEREISLPLFDGMSDADAGDVIEATKKVLAYYAK